MKIVFFSLLFLVLSSKTTASFVGDSISISGVPGLGMTNTTIDSDTVEIQDPSSPSIQFYCGNSTNNGFVCGFLNTAVTGTFFNVDIFEHANGKVQIDTWFGGTFGQIDVLFDGFNSAQAVLGDVTVISDFDRTARFIDPNTGQVIEPLITATDLGNLPGPPLGNALSASSSQTSVSFSIDPGTYNHQFSLLIDTTAIPLPKAAWLFLSALFGMTRFKRSKPQKSL